MEKAEHIKRAIKASLAATGRTTSAMAKACSMSRANVYLRYRDGDWRINELAAIASYLGWSPSFLSSLISECRIN